MSKPSSSSVSVSSSLGLGFRLRRTFLVSRRGGGPGTPMPSWKVSDGSLDFGHRLYEASQGPPISARKLGASLWELQELLFLTDRPTGMALNELTQDQQEPQHITINVNSPHDQQHGPVLTPASGCIGPNERPPHETKIAADAVPKSLMNHRRKGVLGKEGTTSELLKVLNHVWSLEEQHASSMYLVDGLRLELDQARTQLEELLLAQESHRKEVENISERITEERALWQEQLEQSIKAAVRSIKKELEDEKKSKQTLQVANKKSEKELRRMRKNSVKALEDLERERKARELMDQVCDELAKEIGQDKAKVEELKRESVKVREEVEEERKMLQMAEVWREERVQMKLMEAKHELEEKNTALEKLRSELELYLKARRAAEAKNKMVDSRGKPLEVIIGQNLGDSFRSREHKVFVSGRQSGESTCGGGSQGKQGSSMSVPSAEDSDDNDDDHDHDLHSIELNHERRRENVQEDVQGHGSCLPHSEWIRHSSGGDELRKWHLDQHGESISLQQTEAEASQSHASYVSPEVRERSGQAYSERISRAASGSVYGDAMISRTW